ncbi:hypothetical protein [Croceibacter atlanticus]|uniref:hypothetical protein n=1 Tax=Croceibacter atlanticus TaxID=313588 RepID=UPI0030D807DB|tara:strand:- start:60 stop:434 length:375 start_codon:yes stop_codon:yes gene_type:complete
MSEFTEHKAIANYLKLQYPKTIFTSDSSGIRLSIGNAKKMLSLKASYKIPDLIILQPNDHYCGLIIEIKAKDKSPFLKDGSLSKSNHVQQQNNTLQMLNDYGYKAVFGVGFEDCINIIDNYFNN